MFDVLWIQSAHFFNITSVINYSTLNNYNVFKFFFNLKTNSKWGSGYVTITPLQD